MSPLDFLSILHTAERLKDTPRHCTTTNGRTKSVAEHSWRTALMAMLLKNEFPQIDTEKVTAMCIIHDLGECFTGDIPTFVKTDNDRKTEDSLLSQWVKTLPPEISARFADLYAEMEQQQTPEAKLFKAIDKLEALIQHNESPISTWSPNEYALNLTYAFDVVQHSPWLTALRQEVLNETKKKIETNK